MSKYEHVPHMEEIITQMKELLSKETLSKQATALKSDFKLALESVAGKAMLRTMMLNIGDRVLVDNCKGAILRFFFFSIISNSSTNSLSGCFEASAVLWASNVLHDITERILFQLFSTDSDLLSGG